MGGDENMRISNFMKDLQQARKDDEAPQMENLKIRGFTKVQELLAGFENESDFQISMREQSVHDQS